MRLKDVFGLAFIGAGVTVGALGYRIPGLQWYFVACIPIFIGMFLIWSAERDRFEATVLGGQTDLGAVNALFLARSTWNALRQLLLYVHDPEITHPALQILLTSSQLGARVDPP